MSYNLDDDIFIPICQCQYINIFGETSNTIWVKMIPRKTYKMLLAMIFAKKIFCLVQEMVGSWLNKEMVGSDRFLLTSLPLFYFNLFNKIFCEFFMAPVLLINFFFENGCLFFCHSRDTSITRHLAY